tara:strand:- start:2132 stop:2629 length:498 start_codon:yes stop_codon:yes gene_type:complete
MIYLIRAEETNLYKIGYTASSTESRVKTLQTGCPHKLFLVGEALGSLEKEKWLHKTFKKYRKQGEWFEFDEKTAEKAFEKLCEERKTEEEDIEGFRDMYERHIRDVDCDFSMEDFLYLGILEIMLGNYDTAIQRLREYQTIIYGGSYLKIIPPLTEKIYREGKDK